MRPPATVRRVFPLGGAALDDAALPHPVVDVVRFADSLAREQ